MCFESSEARPHLMVSRNVPPNISCLMPIRTERSVVGRLRGKPIPLWLLTGAAAATVS
ncbi:hypothetical protein FHT78_005720 [Rhizobium sp. BK196]|nr:hypothetical protein [Rhizobium sp. BK196]MBB3463696.1 hypothetical protein [Rhizobium sp. BK377]